MNKKSDLGNLYRKLYEAYSAAYADKKKKNKMYKKKLTPYGKV